VEEGGGSTKVKTGGTVDQGWKKKIEKKRLDCHSIGGVPDKGPIGWAGNQ